MREISKEQFYATVGARDVHPSPERDVTWWKERHSGGVVGKSTPGYMGGGPKRYFVPEHSID